MSSSNRTTSKGGKGSKADKTHKDKSDTGKASEKQQQHKESTNKSEDISIKEKVRTLLEISQRSEEEVCLALYECDYDVNMASNMLLENMVHGEWETRVKKKKNRQASASKQEKSDENVTTDDWDDGNPQITSGGGGGSGTGNNNGGYDKEKSRNKSGGPPRLHGRHNDSRGWRGREKHENERNLEDGSGGGGGGRSSDFHRDRRGGGRSGGAPRGPGGRGRGGGRAGGRYPPRGNRNGSNYNKQTIDTWDNSNTWDNNTVANTNHTENWDDFPGTDEWSTEEYTGSLADTKVFTPSVQQQQQQNLENESIAPPPVDSAVINSATSQLGQSPQLPSQPTGQISGQLNAAQTQYLNQLTQQNSDNIKQYGSAQTFHAQNSTQVYNTTQPSYNNTQQYGTSPANNYVNNSYTGVSNNYTANTQEQPSSQQPVRTKTQRARVPPPSKIPASAVEMPGDINSSIGYLDVQFGAMDFMSDTNSFDGNETKYGGNNNTGTMENSTVTSTGSGNLDLTTANQNSTLDPYTTNKNSTQSSISSLSQSVLTNTESIPQTSDHLTGSYNTTSRNTTAGNSTTPSAPSSALDINKQNESHSYSQPSTYNSYQTKANSYNASTYSGTQTTSNSYVSNQAANSYVNSQSTPYNPSSANTYQNAYSSTNSYQSNTNPSNFPSISQANSYPTNNQSYQTNPSQSVYGASTGLNNSGNFGNTSSTSQYNSYSTTANHKIVKDNSYDNSSNSVNNTQTTTTTNSSTSSTSISLTQTTVSGTKSTTTTLTAKNSNSVVSNIPPGVTPVMSTPYIMGQVPYFQQPVYSYEDMQMLQQRLPHMTTPYYDMSYQTPTTLAAVRDATLGNVGYSLSDGRFTRGDNNASPVPSTLSQQTSTLTQGHQAQPILAGAGPPYFFTAAFNTLAPNYQFGTMYTQLPTATNAHGSSNSNQYPKPATYGSGYGSYDTLSQTQDYSKGGYVGNNQGQKGAGVNATSAGSTANDLTAMYGKSHAALGKVNSYDKQGFHSGTPPPFTGALHGGQNAGLAPSGTGYPPQVYIPTMTPHQQQLSTHLMQQPLHQMDVRHQGRRVDSGNSSGQRSQGTNQAKSGAKQPYQNSYWNQA